MENVILVDEQDEPIGAMEKLLAHRQGRLHRAISVFIFNTKGELLLQRRALSKYHSAGLWTNTCCSHPRPDEDASDAAARRLFEEMGIVSDLKHRAAFIYRADFENGLTEHEYDHVFIGVTDDLPSPDPDEVMEWRYQSPEAIKQDIEQHPEQFSFWFKLILGEGII